MTLLEEMIDSGVFLGQEKKSLKGKKSLSLSSQIILVPGKQGMGSLELKANARSQQFCLLWLLWCCTAKGFNYRLF